MSAEDTAEKSDLSRRRDFAPSKDSEKSGDALWEAYLGAVQEEDTTIAESWNGSTNGILTFTGLFAATVAAFVLESYNMLLPDPSSQSDLIGNQALILLAQLVSAGNNTPDIALPQLQAEPFEAPRVAVVVNSLWFVSLVISLVCALLATLIQEWTRDFLRDIRRRTPDMTLRTYTFNHIYVRMGVESFKLDYVTSFIVALMHVAVILFLVGLVMFLRTVHHTLATVVEITCIVAASIYFVFSVLPFLKNSCPYRTPLTYIMFFVGWLSVLLIALIFQVMCMAVLVGLSTVLFAPFLALFLPSYAALFTICIVVIAICLAIMLPFVAISLVVLFIFGVIWGLYQFHSHSWTEIFEWVTQQVSSSVGKRAQRPEVRKALGFGLSVLRPLWYIIAALRFYMHCTLPTRRLPGQKDVPVYIPEHLGVSYLAKRLSGEEHFITDNRLLFLWEHTCTHFLSSERRVDLADNLLRSLDLNTQNHGAFCVYLRHSDAFLRILAQSMSSLESSNAEILGMLELLKILLGAKHDIEYWIMEDDRWTAMKRHKITDCFVGFSRMITRVSPAHPSSMNDRIRVLMGLFELRQTLILMRYPSISINAQGGPRNKSFLDEMLQSFESIEGLALITIYSNPLGSLPDEDIEKASGRVWRRYEYALRNILVLLVNLLYLDPNAYLCREYLTTIMAEWKELTNEAEFTSFKESSLKRMPSSPLIYLLSTKWPPVYSHVLDQFSALITPTNSQPPRLYQELPAGEQAFRAIPITFAPPARRETPYKSEAAIFRAVLLDDNQSPEDGHASHVNTPDSPSNRSVEEGSLGLDGTVHLQGTDEAQA
ncbi:unnamed protein product [Peniophora sp. CBMAI 1063]|nr:unnamed protein product [Peniophora sp. CBMAI 1063]